MSFKLIHYLSFIDFHLQNETVYQQISVRSFIKLSDFPLKKKQLLHRPFLKDRIWSQVYLLLGEVKHQRESKLPTNTWIHITAWSESYIISTRKWSKM